MDLHLRHAKRTAPFTNEQVTRISELAPGGETTFKDANLRPQDEVWWLTTTGHIVTLIERAIEATAMSDEELVAQMPVVPHYQSDQTKALEKQQFMSKTRAGGSLILVLGFLIRDTERIYLESIHMGDGVIKARAQLRGFAWAIALETDLYTVYNTESDE